MITAKEVLKDYIKAQESIKCFSDHMGISRYTIYNILKGKSLSSNVVAKLLKVTGFNFKEAFRVTHNSR